MTKFGLSVLLVVAGCDSAFDLTKVKLREAADAPGPDVFVPELNCPPAYSTEFIAGGSRYRIAAQSRTASMQHAFCADDSAGKTTHLAVIDSLPEAEAIQAALNASGTYAWFVGVVQARNQATATMGWVWVTGEPVGPGSWRSGEPNDYTGGEDNEEQIGYLINVGLVDGFATAQYHALCECDGRPVDAVAGDLLATSS